MAPRILINGAFGKMGLQTTKALSNPHWNIVALTGIEDNLSDAIDRARPDIAIDFTRAQDAFKNASIMIQAKVHPVIGTSGLIEAEVKELQAQAAETLLGGIIAPNFSLGAVLMMKYAKEIIQYLPNAEIIEMHHAGKLDSPSGTALRTAELLSAARKTDLTLPKDQHSTVAGARGAVYKNVPIHAIRLPGLLAGQQIIFGNPGETLTLRHDTIDRACFMPGVELACRKVLELKGLVYGLENIL